MNMMVRVELRLLLDSKELPSLEGIFSKWNAPHALCKRLDYSMNMKASAKKMEDLQNTNVEMSAGIRSTV